MRDAAVRDTRRRDSGAWNRRAAALTARLSFAVIPLFIGACMAARAVGALQLAAAMELPFSLFCHRLPDRVAAMGGVAMPLCSRCAGMWLGFATAVVLGGPRLSLRRLRLAVALASTMTLLEMALQDAVLHRICHATRLASGLLLTVPLGGALAAVIARELAPPR